MIRVRLCEWVVKLFSLDKAKITILKDNILDIASTLLLFKC